MSLFKSYHLTGKVRKEFSVKSRHRMFSVEFSVSLHVSASQTNCSNLKKKSTVQFTTKWFCKSHTSKARCCCCAMPNLINNWVEQYNLVSFWSIPSLISDRSYSAPVLPSVLLHLWQSSSVRKLWSTNYILCAMTTYTLLLSAKYAPPLHFLEVCAVTCHPS